MPDALWGRSRLRRRSLGDHRRYPWLPGSLSDGTRADRPTHRAPSVEGLPRARGATMHNLKDITVRPTHAHRRQRGQWLRQEHPDATSSTKQSDVPLGASLDNLELRALHWRPRGDQARSVRRPEGTISVVAPAQPRDLRRRLRQHPRPLCRPPPIEADGLQALLL